MVEPIGHTGGIIDPPPEYLPILRDICDRHNVLLIFDEIITGIGRTGHLFAAETFGVVPDVLCTAKGLSGGYAPLSAMICRQPIADAFWGPIAREPRFRRGPHVRGQSDLLRGRHRRAARDPRARPVRQCPRSGRTAPRRFRAAGRQARRHRRHPRQGTAARRSSSSRDVKTKEQFPADVAFGVRVGRRALANGLLCRFDPHWIAFGPPLIVDERADRRDGRIVGSKH